MYVLSEADHTSLRDMLTQFRRGVLNTRQRPHVEDADPWIHDVYVAFTPAGGIPPNVIPGSGTGTGSGNQPAAAPCDVYRDDGTSLSPAGFQVEVYNLSSAAVQGHSWILALRDKFGTFFAIPTATRLARPSDSSAS